MRSSHIIIEGLDKTGKTTLANYLSEKLSMPIKKFSAPTGDPYKEYKNFLAKETQPHIIDRCYLSEIAYGPVKRGKSFISYHKEKTLESICAANKITVIYCEAEYEDLVKRFMEDKEEYLKIEDIKPIEKNYRKAGKRSSLEWLPYRIGDDMEILANQLKDNAV